MDVINRVWYSPRKNIIEKNIMTSFTKINIQAQVVNGHCPICTEESIFVSIYKTIFRCVTCGADIEQKINGKISYMPHVSKKDGIHIKHFNE
tara:strand:+ start:123 stop:398 length:276 start_codon:yes stop_codon:yes gene_type:complete